MNSDFAGWGNADGCSIGELVPFVEFHGWLQDAVRVFLAMEYCASGDLEKNMPKGGRLPEEEVKLISTQVLKGVRNMHQEGFVHLGFETSRERVLRSFASLSPPRSHMLF